MTIGGHAIPGTIDAYLAGFPDEVQVELQQLRRTIREAAPEAREAMKYGMPAVELDGPLV